MNKYVGAHLSAVGGCFNAILEAEKINCRSLAFFLKNQKRWIAHDYTFEEIQKFQTYLNKSNIAVEHVLPHAGYLLNLCSPKIEVMNMSVNSLIDEINRANLLNLKMINIHMGSHLKLITEEEAMEKLILNLNFILKKTKNIIIVLENSAGQGGNIGYNLKQIKYVLSKIEDQSRIGVCIDTCHSYAAGYDLNNKFEEFWQNFDLLIGKKYLKAIHLNDSMENLNSKKDRHENIGLGYIDISVFKKIMKSDYFNNIPLILETRDSSKWKEEIKMLYNFEKI